MKRSKVLSILLAVMMVLSTMSCLSVVSFAANVVASGYTPDTENAEIPENRVLAWEFYDDGVLYLYDYPGEVSWKNFADVLTKVELKAGPKATQCNLIEIPAYAFVDCYNLVEVDVSKGVKLQTIGAYAFQGCSALTNIALDQGIISLGDYAFYGCSALERVEFSYNLANVGKNVFKGCSSLETAIVPNGVLTIGYGMFEDCTALKTIELPDSLVTIGELAFENCTNLEAISVPDSTTTVGRYAFYNCAAIKNLYIGHSAQEIGEYAFGKCSSLANVNIASAMRSLSEGMFMDCTALASIALEEGVVSIGKNAFKGCSGLSEIKLPSTLRIIGDSAFDGTALTTIDIPADVETIERGAFTNCNSLTAINVDDKNDFYFSVDGVLYDVKLNTLMLCPAGKKGEVTVWDGTTAIADDAFIGCKGVTKVTIPNSVMQIASNAFNNCATTLIIKGDCDSQGIAFANARGMATELVHTGSKVWNETTAPSCLEKGAEELVCENCGFVYETQEIESLGHDYDDGVVTTKATCDADGVMTFTCTRPNCSISYTEVIPALKHKYNTGEVIQAATCTEDGTMRYSCTNDGCLDYYDKVINMLGHDMDDGTIKTPATCEKDGEKIYKCKNAGCLYKETEVLTAIGHKYDKGVVTTPATCTEDGVMTYTCQNDTKHTYTDKIDAKGHSYDSGVVTTAPTCTENGVKTYTCQNTGCEDAYTEKVDAIGHDYVAAEIKKATCLENGKIQHTCANCGDFYNEATKGEHVPYSTPVKVGPTCTEAGKEGTMCAVCRQFIGETKELAATGHTYENGVCSGCGDKKETQAPSKPGSTVITPEKNPESTGGSSNSGTASNAPAIPKLLLLSNRNEGLVLTWKAVEGATGYRVYRRAAGAKSWTYLGTVKECTYTDKDAATGQYWRYTVRAVNDAGFSGFENGIYIKRVATPHLTSIANAANGVKITWSAVSNAKTYKIYRRGAGETWKCIATVTGTSYVDTAIRANSGNYYRYTVRAIDGYYSAYESGLLIKYVAAPHLTGIANTSNGVKVDWKAVSGADSYRVYRRAAGKSWVYVTTVTGTSYVDTSVKNANGYYKYTVRAVDGSFSGYESGLLIKK